MSLTRFPRSPDVAPPRPPIDGLAYWNKVLAHPQHYPDQTVQAARQAVERLQREKATAR